MGNKSISKQKVKFPEGVTEEKIIDYKNRLPRGSSMQIADDLGLTVGHVRRVLRAEAWNKDVIEMAVSIIKKEEEELTTLMSA